MSDPVCVVYIACSADGFIARVGGAIDWLSVVERAGEDYGFAEFFASVDTVLMGRTTYDSVLSFPDWPFAEKRVAVLTHRPPAPRHGERFVEGEPRDVVAELERAGASRIYVDGGVALSQFVAAGLVSELTLSIIPILLGEGPRLTQRLGRDVPLKLVTSKAFPTGLVQNHYTL